MARAMITPTVSVPPVPTGSSTGRPADARRPATTPTTTGTHAAEHSRLVALTAWLLARMQGLTARLGMQPAGWIVLAIAVISFVAGGGLGWIELRILSVACLVVLACAVVFTLGRQTYAVTLRLQSHQVVVGERALGDLEVVNTSDRRLLPARIELPVGRRLASFGLPSLPGKAAHEEVFAVPTTRRTVIRVGPARTVRGDPLGLMGREILWTSAVDLFVHPRTIRIPGRQGGFIRDLEGHPTSRLTSSDISFHALREYSPGDDRRYVHWKSSAKTGTLLVRQFEETRRSQVAVGLDLGAGSYAGDDEFEVAVSVAGSLALQALRDDNLLTVLTTSHGAGARLRAVSPNRTLDELSTVELRPRGDAFGLARYVHRSEPNASVVALVTGPAADLTALRRASTVFDPDVRVLAIRIELGAPLTVQTTQAISAVTLGALADLPRAVRRASL